MNSMFEIYGQAFNKFKVWGLWWPFQNLHPSFLEVLHCWFWGILWIIVLLEYPTSLQLQYVDWTLASSIFKYLVASILPSTRTILPVLPAAIMVFFSPKASSFFLQTYLLWWWPKSYNLVSLVKSTLFQKASGFSILSFAYFRHLI